MTNIRASGFDNKNQLQEHLDEQFEEEGAAAASYGDAMSLRDAQLELSWLRKEVSDLRQSLAIASGAAEIKSLYKSERYRRNGGLLIAAAGISLVLLFARS